MVWTNASSSLALNSDVSTSVSASVSTSVQHASAGTLFDESVHKSASIQFTGTPLHPTVSTYSTSIASTNTSISNSTSPGLSTMLTNSAMPTQVASPSTPSIPSSQPRHAGTPHMTSPGGHTITDETRTYGFDLNPHWQEDKDHFDNQKINGLTFPRTIRQSAFSQKLDIEGCDPLKLPVAALLYQQANNFWLRKLAHGRELYLIPTGDIAAVVFTTELLTQLRNKGVDIDKVASSKARQDGKFLDKTQNTKYAAQQIADLIHGWVPTRAADPETQHELTQLRSQLAQLRQQLGDDTTAPNAPGPTGPSASSPPATPIQAAFMRTSNSPAPPAQLRSILLACRHHHTQSVAIPTHATNSRRTSLQQMAQRSSTIRAEEESPHGQHRKNRRVVGKPAFRSN